MNTSHRQKCKISENLSASSKFCITNRVPWLSNYTVFIPSVHLKPSERFVTAPLIGCTLASLTYILSATQASCGATEFCIIRRKFSSVQSRPFWFIPLDTAMIAKLKYVYQVSVKQKIKTIRRVEAKERKRNLYTTFLLSLLFVTFIK